jgi:ATP-dependent Clp protease ATP-binding subunit ClpA
LVEKGYDIHMGARPMERVIQEYIKKPLAELVLFGALAKSGGTALVRLNKSGDALDVVVEEEELEAEACSE